MHAGPKRAVDPSPLRWRPRGSESERFAQFCRNYLRLSDGKPLILRAWPRDLVASVWGERHPRMAAWALARATRRRRLLPLWSCKIPARDRSSGTRLAVHCSCDPSLWVIESYGLVGLCL